MNNVPYVLVASKCDQHPAHREVDPAVVEQKAKSFLGDIHTFQTSEASPEVDRGFLSVITRAVIAAKRRECISICLGLFHSQRAASTCGLRTERNPPPPVTYTIDK